jgi:sporulation protein YlmC with PRC-barrel domain
MFFVTWKSKMSVLEQKLSILGDHGMLWPLQCLLTAAALHLALAVPPTVAQGPKQGPERQQAPAAKPQPSLVGLQIYTSDGKSVGKVIATGLDEDDEPVLVGEIERQLGIGPTAIAVPLDMYVRKGDRIELTLTEAEVNAKLGR